MNHYTYEITFNSGKKYIGVRSCKCQPEEDTSYLGSSKIIPPEDYLNCTKVILKTFDTRPLAVLHEAELHATYNVKNNPLYYNQVNQTSDKFDQQGCTKETHIHVAKMAEALKGRTKENTPYIAEASVKRRTLTDKQKERYASRKGIPQGPNPKKSLSGANSPATKPWYYITPDLQYVEVYTSISEFINTYDNVPPELTERAIKYHVTQTAHKPVLKGSMKGYTVGRLHSKPEYINQENLDLYLSLAGHLHTGILQSLHKIDLSNRAPATRDPNTGRLTAPN